MSQIPPGGDSFETCEKRFKNTRMKNKIKKEILGYFLTITPIAMVISGIICMGANVSFWEFLKVATLLIVMAGMFITRYKLLGLNADRY